MDVVETISTPMVFCTTQKNSIAVVTWFFKRKIKLVLSGTATTTCVVGKRNPSVDDKETLVAKIAATGKNHNSVVATVV